MSQHKKNRQHYKRYSKAPGRRGGGKLTEGPVCPPTRTLYKINISDYPDPDETCLLKKKGVEAS